MKKQFLHNLLLGADECETFEFFCLECGGTLPDMTDSEAIDLLKNIWEYHIDPSFKTILKISGMTQKRFAETYNIPLRTIEDWATKRKTSPTYVSELLLSDILF